MLLMSVSSVGLCRVFHCSFYFLDNMFPMWEHVHTHAYVYTNTHSWVITLMCFLHLADSVLCWFSGRASCRLLRDWALQVSMPNCSCAFHVCYWVGALIDSVTELRQEETWAAGSSLVLIICFFKVDSVVRHIKTQKRWRLTPPF